MGNDSSSAVVPALHLLLRVQLLYTVCAGVVVVSGLEGQQVLVAHLGGLHRDPHSTYWLEEEQGWVILMEGNLHLVVVWEFLWCALSPEFQVEPSCLLSLSSCSLVPSGSQQVNIPHPGGSQWDMAGQSLTETCHSQAESFHTAEAIIVPWHCSLHFMALTPNSN